MDGYDANYGSNGYFPLKLKIGPHVWSFLFFNLVELKSHLLALDNKTNLFLA